LFSTGFYFIFGAFQRVAHCAPFRPGGYALRAGFGHVKSIMGSGRDTRAWHQGLAPEKWGGSTEFLVVMVMAMKTPGVHGHFPATTYRVRIGHFSGQVNK